MIQTIISFLGLGGGLLAFFLWRRGRKVDYNPEDPVVKKIYNQEDVEDIVETSFEVLEVEEKANEEFDNKVVRLEQEIRAMGDDDLVEYFNTHFLATGDDHAIVPAEDRSRFEWESKID